MKYPFCESFVLISMNVIGEGGTTGFNPKSLPLSRDSRFARKPHQVSSSLSLFSGNSKNDFVCGKGRALRPFPQTVSLGWLGSSRKRLVVQPRSEEHTSELQSRVDRV